MDQLDKALQDTIGSPSYWKDQTQWCSLFHHHSWVVREGDFNRLRPTITSKTKNVTDAAATATTTTTLVVQSVVVYDMEKETNKWLGGSTQPNLRTFGIDGRRIETSSLSLSNDFFQYRALKVASSKSGSRWFVSKRCGPSSATKAFESIINRKENEADKFEVMVNVEVLHQVLQMMRDVNQKGGLATCTIVPPKNKDGWFALRNMTLLGFAAKVSPSTTHGLNAYEMQKRRHVGFDKQGCMIDLSSTTSPVQNYTTGAQTVPISAPSGTTKLFDMISKKDEATIEIPCATQQWKLHKETADIELIRKEHMVERKLPLRGLTCSIKYSRKGGGTKKCPEIVAVCQGGENDTVHWMKDEMKQQNVESIPNTSALAILGATVEQYANNDDVHSYVAVTKQFRETLQKQLVPKKMKGKEPEQQKPLLSLYYEPATATVTDPNDAKAVTTAQKPLQHHAGGWKGTYTVYRARPVVSIGSTWYWLDTIESTAGKKPNPELCIHYLQL